MTSDFAPEVAKYPSATISGVQTYCFAPLAMQFVFVTTCMFDMCK